MKNPPLLFITALPLISANAIAEAQPTVFDIPSPYNLK